MAGPYLGFPCKVEIIVPESQKTVERTGYQQPRQ